MSTPRPLALILAGLMVLLGACAPSSPGGGAPPANSGQSGAPAANPASTGPKIIRIALSRERNGLVISLSASASTSGGAIQAQNLPANKLQNMDEKGTRYAELAEALPSTTNGTWLINADGTMETTWKLRPNIKWHDGQPVTTDDLVFGFQAA